MPRTAEAALWRGVLAAALAAVAVSVESLSVPSGTWGAVALAMGIGLALSLRWGRAALLGAGAALWATQVALHLSDAAATSSTLSALVGMEAARRLLIRNFFDRRLDRLRDIAWLLVACFGLAAPLATLVPAVWLGISATVPWMSLLADAITRSLALGAAMLIGALPFLTAERFALSMPPDGTRAATMAALGIATLVCAGLSIVYAGTAFGGLLAAAPFVLLPGLLTQGGIVVAGTTLLLSSVVMCATATAQGMLMTRSSAAFQTQLAGPILAQLALLLMAHASRSASVWRENRWEWALDGSRLGVADWHLRDESAFVSAAWVRLTGHGEGPWTPQQWLARVHPEDRSALSDAIADVASGRHGRQQIEIRMPGPASSWRWFETTLLVIERSPAGEPHRLLATVSDVDERHDAQQRQRLSVSLFQHLHEGLLITDENLRALDVNPAYTQILGVSRDEVLGSVPSLLRPSPPDPLARQQRVAMWDALRSSGSWKGELLERRRNGELCTLQATISTVPGPTQDLRYHVLVISDITEQQVQRERLERQAHFDELTRLPNRTRLSELMSDAMRAADRDGYLLAVCYLDLDHFKPVNDRFGHAAGDRLLVELAGRLRSALRTRETWADAAARLGGDEFVLLLRAGTLEEARLAVERVLRVVAQPYMIDPAGEALQVTASMGATVYPIDRSDADTLLRHADHAMYGAKQSGRNGYLFFDPEHRRRTEERVMAIGRVQEALDQSEFVLYYQPKVDMRTGVVLGLEALLRWDHPQHGLIAPMQFLPLIENTGLSSRVGDWVLSQALEHLSAWRRAGLDLSVGVNISARHLQEPDFALRLSELLARYPEPLAEHLELEMLETAAHADIDATSALLARCRAIGVRFALDDFGTGYSTLTYLKRLPVDSLKIDRSFVHHMLDDAQDRAIVEGVIGLARTFGCTVIAEGVESPAQARTLLDLGCQIGQGTGIAAPMPAGLVKDWVSDYKGMFSLAPAATTAQPAVLAPQAPTLNLLAEPQPPRLATPD